MTTLVQLADRGLLHRNVVLAGLTTYKMGGPAAYYLEVHEDAELDQVAAALREDPHPLLVLGRGSNLMISDRGFPGLVVRLGPAYSFVRTGADDVLVAGGTTSLPLLARESVELGRAGLEFLVGIPGSVGGAVRMNAGGHGSETSEWLVGARVFSFADAATAHRSLEDLELGYRTSSLTDDEVVLDATFRTKPGDPHEGRTLLREITRWRREHQPGGTRNAGSVFKNPPGDFAGRIIDSLGLKGLAVGGASVSTKHANFFEAEPGAAAQDAFDLVQEVRRRVGEETGVWLEPEIRFFGDFDTGPSESESRP